MSQKPQASRSKKAAGKNGEAKTQAERFIETARSIGVDESGKEFNRALKKIAPPKRGLKQS